MIRAIWKGNIQFGPVHVPIKLYTAVEDIRSHSHLLHDHDLHRLQQRMVCAEEDQPVEQDQIVKGYPLDEHHYVVMEKEELESLVPQASRRIEVVEFVPVDQVDPRYLERTYYVGPDESKQDYVDLAAALSKSQLAGVCRWVMRKKDYLGLLECGNSTISLTACRYPDEIIPQDSLSIPEAALAEKEKEAAMQLIAAMAGDFTPQHYTDEYQGRLKTLIEQKARGEEVTLPKPKKIRQTRQEDLLDKLQSSLATITKEPPKTKHAQKAAHKK